MTWYANPDILDRIMARKREEVTAARRQHPESALLHRVRQGEIEGQAGAQTRGFAAALKEAVTCAQKGSKEPPAIIAEIKRGSPSKGIIVPKGVPFVPADIAQGYAKHGATCLSCLTDRDFFRGEDAFLAEIKHPRGDQDPPMTRPVLRKDFLFDPYQVVQSRVLGADAILLILAVLTPHQALELEATAREMTLDVLVEVHDEREMEMAHDLKTPLLGINNRNLKTFTTDLETSLRLAPRADSDRLIVSESGIHTAQDMARLRDHGIHAFLIGEALMREKDPGAALQRLLAEVTQNPQGDAPNGLPDPHGLPHNRPD